MLLFENGTFEGGISGGCLEGDALKRSQMAILQDKPSIVTYDTSKDDENQIGVGLGCNGVIDVLISPLSEDSNTLKLLQKCVDSRQPHILVTITASSLDSGAFTQGNTFYYDTTTKILEGCDNTELNGLFSADAEVVLSKQKSKIFHYELDNETLSAFIELIPPQFHLAIFGDNYDVYPMIDLAKVMDWEVSLVGNLQKLKKTRLQSVNNIYLKDQQDGPAIDDRTAVILMAHDYKTDLNNLQLMLNTPTRYIASLGPKKRFNKIVDELKANGRPLTEEELDRIYAPCGLEIGANTPEEIATSIFAEILAVFSNKEGGLLRKKSSPIHDRDY